MVIVMIKFKIIVSIFILAKFTWGCAFDSIQIQSNSVWKYVSVVYVLGMVVFVWVYVYAYICVACVCL